MQVKVEGGEAFVKRLPLALALAVVVQLATVVWWVAARDRDSFFMAQRVSVLEAGAAHVTDNQAQIIERLARIEERSQALMQGMDRIEKRVSAKAEKN